MLALLMALAPATAISWQQHIRVDWGYTPSSSPAVTGYQLYQEGVKSCLWSGAATTAGDCNVELTKQTTRYTLTAVFADGTESPHSAPFDFVYTQAAPILINIGLAQ